MKLNTLIFLYTISSIEARSIPRNVQDFYDTVRSGTCPSHNVLKSGFRSQAEYSPSNVYCKSTRGDFIWIDGPRGRLTDMDIDCDGDQSNNGDGRCRSSRDTQGQTTFFREVERFGIRDVDAKKIPYVVLGNEAGVKFNPQRYGVRPLSIVAVVCGNQLLYGVWADTNGDRPGVVGEASLSLATACFGSGVQGNRGHTGQDVLYIAFPGEDAVPGGSANWRARNFEEFERSIQGLGDQLISRIAPLYQGPDMSDPDPYPSHDPNYNPGGYDPNYEPNYEPNYDPNYDPNYNPGYSPGYNNGNDWNNGDPIVTFS